MFEAVKDSSLELGFFRSWWPRTGGGEEKNYFFPHNVKANLHVGEILRFRSAEPLARLLIKIIAPVTRSATLFSLVSFAAALVACYVRLFGGFSAFEFTIRFAGNRWREPCRERFVVAATANSFSFFTGLLILHFHLKNESPSNGSRAYGYRRRRDCRSGTFLPEPLPEPPMGLMPSSLSYSSPLQGTFPISIAPPTY